MDNPPHSSTQNIIDSPFPIFPKAHPGDGLVLLLFLGPRRPEPLTVRHLSSAATWWNGAADQLLQQLRTANLQRNQLLSLDAHNDGPNEAVP